MGILMFVQTIMLIESGHRFLSKVFIDSHARSVDPDMTGKEMDKYMETCLFLQISNSSAILILSARTRYFFFSTIPAWQLMLSTAIGQVLINLWVCFPVGGLVAKLKIQDVLAIWIYDIMWLLLLDVVKMTAGYLWEILKPPDIDKNPALSSKNRKSRRMSNNLMAGAGPIDQKVVDARKAKCK